MILLKCPSAFFRVNSNTKHTCGGTVQQRRRAKRSYAGAKRPAYKGKKPAREGPLRGLTVAETVGLRRVAPEEHSISAIMSGMSPPKRKKRKDRSELDYKILQVTVDCGKNFSATEFFPLGWTLERRLTMLISSFGLTR